MAVVSFNSNPASRTVQRSLSAITDNLRRVSERLSSGLRINRASDDAAGLAVSSSLDAATRIYSQGIRNANDAISALNIADGGLGEMSSMLTRMKELATQSSNGTLSSTQRKSLDREAQALASEFERLQSTTTFNGIRLIANNMTSSDIQLGYGRFSNLNINLGIYGTSSTTTGSSGSTVSQIIPGPTVYTGTTSTYGVGDFNGDGLDDVVTANNSTGTLLVSPSNGSYFDPFQGLSTSYTGSAVAIATGDFNNDGVDDFVLGLSNGDIAVYQSLGGGGFNNIQLLSVGALSGVKPLVSDMNGDGFLDIVFAKGTQLVTLVNANDGTFVDVTSSKSASSTITSIAAGEFNGDGDRDIVVSAGSALQLFSGMGNGDYSAISTLGVSGSLVANAGDINGDGKDDLVSTWGSSLRSLAGNGAGGFSIMGSTSVTSPTDLATGDYDGDGILDVAVVENYQFVNMMRGDGNGGFNSDASTTPLDFGSAFLMRTGDFNGDGLMDAFVTDGNKIAAFWAEIEQTSPTTTTTVALDSFSLLSAASARIAMGVLDAAMDKVTATRGMIGSSLSRIGSAMGTLQSSRDNSAAASSRIKDADIGAESANYVRLSLLQQTGAALLAQANQIPNLALILLRQ